MRKVHKVKRAECVGNGEEDKGVSLEGKQVWVGGDEDGELKTLKMLEVRTAGSLDLMLLLIFLTFQLDGFKLLFSGEKD